MKFFRFLSWFVLGLVWAVVLGWVISASVSAQTVQPSECRSMSFPVRGTAFVWSTGGDETLWSQSFEGNTVLTIPAVQGDFGILSRGGSNLWRLFSNEEVGRQGRERMGVTNGDGEFLTLLEGNRPFCTIP